MSDRVDFENIANEVAWKYPLKLQRQIEGALRNAYSAGQRDERKACIAVAIQLADDPGTDWFSGCVAREIAKCIGFRNEPTKEGDQ